MNFWLSKPIAGVSWCFERHRELGWYLTPAVKVESISFMGTLKISWALWRFIIQFHIQPNLTTQENSNVS